MQSFRKWLLAGLLVVVPIAITIWVLEWIVSTLDKTLLILPSGWHPDKLLGFHIPGFGVLLAIGILLLLGATASNFFRQQIGQLVARFAQQNSSGSFNLFGREASLRHLVFGVWQRLSQSCIGAVAA